jgi:hypothetical protein
MRRSRNLRRSWKRRKQRGQKMKRNMRIYWSFWKNSVRRERRIKPS